MLLLRDMYESGGVQKFMPKFNTMLFEELGLTSWLMDQPKPIHINDFWHTTRICEYPWAFSIMAYDGDPDDIQTWKDQKILDIGADPKFGICALAMGAKDWTFHHTCEDTQYIGQIAVGMIERHGIHHIFRKYKRNVKMAYGFPDKLDIADGAYDVIFNISVMEHVPGEHIEPWLDGIWRMLKPGGRFIVTCDWLVNEPMGRGIPDHIWNFDYGPWIKKVGGVVTPEDLADCPWHPSFDRARIDPEVLWMTNYPAPMDRATEIPEDLDLKFSVYGFVVEKPA